MIYENEKNPLRVFEIYERLKRGDRCVPEFYEELKSLIDELDMHLPAVIDTVTLRRHRQDLVVSKFLSPLSPSLRS